MASKQEAYRKAQLNPNWFPSGPPVIETSNQEKETIGLEAFDSDSEDDAEAGTLVANMFQQRIQFENALGFASGNRTISDDRAEELLNGLAADVDDDVVYTFREGKKDKFDSNAPEVDIGLFYVPGADLAEVNISENRGISKEEASQKTAIWRVLSAGNVLRELEVMRDLTIKKHDKTASVIAKHRANRGQSPVQVLANATANARSALTAVEDKDKIVNINSKKVKILNEFSEPKVYDHMCTCIEIDAKSLVDLIFNFRQLCSAQGKFANPSAEDTVRILEIMIEDARRLLVRSPILARVAQRVTIQKSQNTRYGFDTGTMFHTYSTSKGIREVIQQSVGYYSSLDEAKDLQGKISHKFMQMVILLISLLNDEDLEILEPILEHSYQLKADRKSIEMAILKVLPCFAVGPHLFLEGVISAFQMKRTSIGKGEEQESLAWDNFLEEAARLGWLLPGTPEDLGRKIGSWKVRWSNFKNSYVFDHLQYCGEKDAINYIPPLRIHSEKYDKQDVSAEFRNGETYFLAAKHLDNITLAVRGRYMITHAETKLQRDLIVKEDRLFKDLDKAAAELEHICNSVNEKLPFMDDNRTRFQRGGSFSSRMGSLTLGTLRPRPRSRLVFTMKKPAGLRTKSTSTILSNDGKEDVIAISWKLEGQKITYKKLLEGVGTDLNFLTNTCQSLKEFADRQKQNLAKQGSESAKRNIDKLIQSVAIVNQSLVSCEGLRKKMMDVEIDKDDEPVLRVHFPGVVHSKQDLPWAKYTESGSSYTQGYPTENWQLVLKSERYRIEEEPTWKASVARLKLGEAWISVMPLKEISEEDQAEEIMKGDTVLLLGGLVAVVVSPHDGGDMVVNFMQLTALDRAKGRRRGGGNRESPAPLYESVLV